MADKEQKYFVLKIEDLRDVCDLEPLVARELEHVIERYTAYRKFCRKDHDPQYIVCNQDEPYAEKVWRIILSGENEKEGIDDGCNTVVMPRTLTAENGAKSALIREFFEKREVRCPYCDDTDIADDGSSACPYCNGAEVLQEKIPVSWTTIKEIYKKAVECCQVR